MTHITHPYARAHTHVCMYIYKKMFSLPDLPIECFSGCSQWTLLFRVRHVDDGDAAHQTEQGRQWRTVQGSHRHYAGTESIKQFGEILKRFGTLNWWLLGLFVNLICQTLKNDQISHGSLKWAHLFTPGYTSSPPRTCLAYRSCKEQFSCLMTKWQVDEMSEHL